MAIWFRSNSTTHRWLSNFWPCRVVTGNMVARSAEHAYQALKFDDEGSVDDILRQPTALAAMRRSHALGYVSPHFDAEAAMKQVLEAKFENPDLHELLLATTEELVEDNRGPWGGRNGGENRLGRLLMELRDELGGA